MVSENSETIEKLLDKIEHRAQTYWDFMSEKEKSRWAWLAGLIDGEGSIDIHRSKSKRSLQASYVARIAIGMTHKDTILRIKEITGLGYIAKRIQHSNLPTQKVYYVWTATTARTAVILRNCLPFLYTKKKHAEVALALIEDIEIHQSDQSHSRSEYREKLRLLMRDLNK